MSATSSSKLYRCNLLEHLSQSIGTDWRSRLPIVARGRYAPEDFRKLQWLLSSYWRTLWWGYLLGAVFGALMIGYWLLTAEKPSELRSAVFTLALFTAGVVVFVVIIVLLPRKREHSDWEASNPPYEPRTLTFHEDGVTVTTEQAHSTVKWGAFVDAQTTAEFSALVVQKDVECVLVPKRFLKSPDDWSALLAMTAAKVVSRN